MPVNGLPSSLEAILNALVQEMCVSSYKIEGKTNHTVVVLRLTTTPRQPSVQLVHNGTAVFRRKCPAQVSRDRRRAEAHRAAKQQASSSSSPSTLFLPTPPSLYYSTDNTTAADTFYSKNDSMCVEDYKHESQYETNVCDVDLELNYNTDIQTESGTHDTTINDDEGVTNCISSPDAQCGEHLPMDTTITQTGNLSGDSDTARTECTVRADTKSTAHNKETRKTKNIWEEILEQMQVNTKILGSIIHKKGPESDENITMNKDGEEGNPGSDT